MQIIKTIDLTNINSQIAQGRLTLTSNTPVLSSNVTGATTLYYTPYTGSQISIWDGSKWSVRTFTERSLSLSGLAANTNYDVFIYDNAGTLTLEAVAWSNSGAGTSARASALSWLNGVRVKDSDKRKYLGSFRTTGTTGQTEFSFYQYASLITVKPFLINEFNREKYHIKFVDPTNTSYSTGTYRLYRASSNACIQLLLIESKSIDFYLRSNALAHRINISINNSIVFDRSGTNDGTWETGSTSSNLTVSNFKNYFNLIGYNEFYLIEYGYVNADVGDVSMSIKEEF